MSALSRLRTALDVGQLILPGGSINIVRPPLDFDIAALGARDVTISHGFAPDHIRWSDAGYDVSVDPRPSDIAIITVPRSKRQAKALVAQAATTARLIVVDGQKTDGVDSLFKAVRALCGDVPSITKGHGRIFWFAPDPAFADWSVDQPERGPHGYWSLPGIYAEASVDKGSALLASRLPDKLPRRMADLGAGWGYLSEAILRDEAVETVDLIEADATALSCARLNVVDLRAVYHWADAIQFTPDAPYAGIVMNPPFHPSRFADPGLGQSFIRAAARMLTPQGQLWMVANRHLPYEDTLDQAFHRITPLEGNGAFKLFMASRPRR